MQAVVYYDKQFMLVFAILLSSLKQSAAVHCLTNVLIAALALIYR